MHKHGFGFLLLFALATVPIQLLHAQQTDVPTRDHQVSLFSGPAFNTIDTAWTWEITYSSDWTFRAWKQLTIDYDVGFLFWSKQSNDIVHRNYAAYFVAKQAVFRHEKVQLNAGGGPAVSIISSKHEATGQGFSDNSDLKLGAILAGEGQYNWRRYLNFALKLRLHIALQFRSFDILIGLSTRLP